jgi:hypothetical protein
MPTMPYIEAMLTMLPDFRSAMALPNVRTVAMKPVAFASIDAFQAERSSFKVRIGRAAEL